MYRKSLRTRKLSAKRTRCAAMREAKDRKRVEAATEWRDVGGLVTDGVLGVHSVRLLASDSFGPVLAVVVDGTQRRPRSLRGVVKCMAEMVYKRMKRLPGRNND